MGLLLVIDVGNTHIAAGVMRGGDIVARGRIVSDANRTADEYGVNLKQIFEARGFEDAVFEGAIMCSVVPGLTGIIREAVAEYYGLSPNIIDYDDYPRIGIEVLYDRPEEVGPDRVINALAAGCIYGSPAVVIDFGTATTFDIIDGDGAYLGGVIMPGLLISAENLFRRAARLSPVPFVLPDRIIGKDTTTAIQAGVMFGTVDAVSGILRRIYEELGCRATTIAAGGFAGTLKPYIENIDIIDNDLTLKGLALANEKLKDE
ncbi:MAG: type III pantothenate kinase [Candidatus Dadabacteria bacterium]|nr:type III pantothenate kinase [Candidatus Dadabacteria bacterium]